MNRLSKLVGLGALSVSLSLLPFTGPASAQTAPATGDSAPAVENEADDGFDWGWLGLLGLIGLAGLAGKKRDDRHVDDAPRYRDPNVGTGTGTYRE